MSFWRKNLGKKGEGIACTFLKRNGFKILARNIKYKFGEIDILAQKGEDIVIVEVKTKASSEFGTPEEEIDYFKKQKLLNLAKAVSQKYPDKNIKIDVIAIKLDKNQEIRHIENAVTF